MAPASDIGSVVAKLPTEVLEKVFLAVYAADDDLAAMRYRNPAWSGQQKARWSEDQAFCTSIALPKVCRHWRDVTLGLTRRDPQKALPGATRRHAQQAGAEFLAWRLPLEPDFGPGAQMYRKAYAITAEQGHLLPIRPSVGAMVVLRHLEKLHVDDLVGRMFRPAYFAALTEIARQAPKLHTYVEDPSVIGPAGAPAMHWPTAFPPAQLFAVMPQLREFQLGGICLEAGDAEPFAQLIFDNLETFRLYFCLGDRSWLPGFVLAQPKLTTLDLRANNLTENDLRTLFSAFSEWASVQLPEGALLPVKGRASTGAFRGRATNLGKTGREITFII